MPTDNMAAGSSCENRRPPSCLENHFQVDSAIDRFPLDPTLHKWRDILPNSAARLAVTDFWCLAFYLSAGLEWHQVELLPTPR